MPSLGYTVTVRDGPPYLGGEDHLFGGRHVSPPASRRIEASQSTLRARGVRYGASISLGNVGSTRPDGRGEEVELCKGCRACCSGSPHQTRSEMPRSRAC